MAKCTVCDESCGCEGGFNSSGEPCACGPFCSEQCEELSNARAVHEENVQLKATLASLCASIRVHVHNHCGAIVCMWCKPIVVSVELAERKLK